MLHRLCGPPSIPLSDFGDEQHAVDLSQRLEDFQRRVGMRREFVALTKRMAAERDTGPVYLEYLATLYASANHDTDLTVTLARLFDHYMAKAEFERATVALERAVEVDAYEGGHQARLEGLKGKVDAGRLGSLRYRLAAIGPATPLQEESQVTANHLAVLEELMVEAELFCRFALMAQAHEALAKIREKFPFEEEHNPRLRELCLTLGLEPRDAPSSRAQTAADSPPQAGGLLKRSAYSDVLLAEIGRAKAQRSPLTLLLLEFAAHSPQVGDTRAAQENRGPRQTPRF